MEYIDTFSGNGYQVGEGNILPRYFADDNNKVCIGRNEREEKILKDRVTGIFYGLRQIRLNQYEWRSGKKFPKCYSTDFIKPTGGEEKQQVESCADCKLKDWQEDNFQKRIVPECTPVIETIFYDLDDKQYATIQWKRTGIKAWKQIERITFANLSKMKDLNPQINPIQQFVFVLQSVTTKTREMEHPIFICSIVRELTQEEKKSHFQAAQGAYKYLLCRQSSELLLTSGQDYDEQPQNNQPDTIKIDEILEEKPPF